MTVEQAFNSFMSTDFEVAVDSSTKASWGGSKYSVELFDDGTYRVLCNNQIGNLYNSPGLIISVPALSEEEWDEDPNIRFYENAEEAIRDIFKQEIHDRRKEMFDSWEGTTAEKNGDNIWIRGPQGQIWCEAFYQTDDQDVEEMEASGYILVPYQLDGENIFVEVVG